MPYCIYLRKSRKDVEAEAHGEGETLARHERALLSLAKKMNLTITKIYREIVSGDSIASRPVMQQLLSDIEKKMWNGVLVMEIERLARGDTIDQGIVAQSFKFSNTQIITPIKTYDPNNEYDEEYFEFGLFMARREYTAIKRRLIRGREAAAREGKFVGSIAPYGYKRVKLEGEKGYTLEIVPEQAEVVRLIFDYYTGNGTPRLGMQALARKLNQMGIPPIRHDYWQKETLREMLDNPTYAGKIRWGWRKTVKKHSDGQVTQSRPYNYNDDCILVKGRHEPIISEEIFDLAQKYIKSTPAPPLNYKSELVNPLAGLIICGKCGRSMVFRRRPSPEKKDYICCHSRACDNVASPFELVEKRLLNCLAQWLEEYTIKIKSVEHKSNSNYKKLKKSSLNNLIRKRETLQKQIENVHNLLEQGIYDVDKFIERSRVLNSELEETSQNIQNIEAEIKEYEKSTKISAEIVSKVELLLKVYHQLPNAEIKNKMLREVISKAIYTKNVHGGFRDHSADEFELIVFPKVTD